jgi:hypothetical protein
MTENSDEIFTKADFNEELLDGGRGAIATLKDLLLSDDVKVRLEAAKTLINRIEREESQPQLPQFTVNLNVEQIKEGIKRMRKVIPDELPDNSA